MGLGKRLLLLAATLVVFNFVLWGIPKIAPEVPERYEGVSVAGPPSDTPTTVPTSLPPGFPSMERPPPKIEVPDGAPQPIATKFGLTYEVPPGWDIWTHGVAKWTAADGTSATYGALGFYERTKCRDGVYSERVLTGMTGKRTLDLGESALTEVEKATLIFSDRDESGKPSVIIDGPENFMIDGSPAVRYHADVTDIPNPETNCTSNSASFDVVATTGHATAETAIFVVKAERGVDGAVTDSDIDDLISTIRKS